MPGSIDATAQTGCISPETIPGGLVLVTGWTDHYQRLEPDHPLHASFARWWRAQQTWDRAAHFDHWIVGLHAWPRKTGNPSLTGPRAAWFAGRRAFGNDDEAIAESLGYSLATMRRLGVLSEAAAIEEWLETTPVAERPLIRCPVIVADGEAHPQEFETWYDPRLEAAAPATGRKRPLKVLAPPRKAA